MNRKIIVLKGLPASGKSTWAKEFVSKNPKWARVNKDDLRSMLHDSRYSKDNEHQVILARNSLISSLIVTGYSVIVDDTNFNPVHLKAIKEIAHAYGAEVEEKFFDVPLEECLKRNRERENAVPEKVIIDMYEKYVNPMQVVPLINDPNKPRCVVCDLDGTLALMRDRRGPFEFNKVDRDEVNLPVFHALVSLVQAETTIVFVSGREDSCYDLTVKWLQDKCATLFVKRGILQEPILYMRKTKDSRKDSIVKEEIYREHIMPNYYVQFVLDDRNQVVDHLRDLGLTVFQVAPGDF